ncbi:hypothetical protein BsWGS_15556 [Bradybaena similaris]
MPHRLQIQAAQATSSMNGEFRYEEWNVQKLTETMRESNIADCAIKAFTENKIDGKKLKALTENEFTKMGLRLGDWFDIREFREHLQHQDVNNNKVFLGNPKIFNDPIHGNIVLNPVCLAIIDTPQFQRLRYLKQLGLVYFVYPGAAHNRFEHSMGVCHLAGQYARSLRDGQKYLGITDQDILCVEIAGLCHDLGHGPYSHTFDQMFIPAVIPKSKWTHEQASKDMFDYLVDKNKLRDVFQSHGLTETDMVFIKELIAPNMAKNGEWVHHGRPQEKSFLYEIVANKRNNIDVDKWDYMARDCHQLGIRNNFDHLRFIQFARVNAVEEQHQICLRDKEVLNLYNMFSTRYTLHKIAYQHQVASSMALMVAHALVKANNHVFIKGSHSKQLKISECINDMEAYSHLTDNILFKILDTESEAEDMKAAKELIRRLFSRDLYKCVYHSKPIDPRRMTDRDEAMIAQEIVTLSENKLSTNDFVVEVVRLDFGMNEENPVERLHVYSKHNPDIARRFPKEEASRILAANYTELLLRVYSCEQRKVRSRSRKVESKSTAITAACEKWFTVHFQNSNGSATIARSNDI